MATIGSSRTVTRNLITSEHFHRIVGGQSSGFGAALLRQGLRLASVPYGVGVRIRNARYDRGRATIHRLNIPVICIGNLTLGGTGKTPMVAWVCKWFRARGVRVTIVSRGYGQADSGQNDEALELAQRLPDVPHLQNPDRFAAGLVAQNELAAEVIVLDDGFQHRRLHRDLDIVLIDALQPFGHGYLFPRGTLREPMHGLQRADAVILTRADRVSTDRRAEIRSALHHYAPSAVWVEMSHQPTKLLSSTGETASLSSLAPMPGADRPRVIGFCGIGNPAGFEQTLAACDYDVTAFRTFPDHHAYTSEDIRSLVMWAQQHAAQAVVCTHKDLVKIGLPELGGKPLWAAQVEMQPRTPTGELEQLLNSAKPVQTTLFKPHRFD